MTKKNSFIYLHRILLLTSLLFLFYHTLQAQESAIPQILVDIEDTNGTEAKIELMQQAQVATLLRMHIANNKMQNGIPGYRIRIFSQSGQPARQKATDTKTEFMKNFPGIEAYMEYREPNFQIIVGDFHSKTEALREYKKISRQFPNAFIVSDIIKLPK